MNILKKLTLTNLKLNKKRTIVTIIGIILSVALITALSTLISSFRESLHEFYIKQRGNYHYAFYDISDDDLKIIKKNNKVESYYLTKGIGYAKIDSKNESKPYVYVLGVNNDDFNSLSINLIKGRLPKNSNEVLIPKHLSSNGSVYYNIGDEISLDIADRYSDGYLLNMNNPYNEEEILDIISSNEDVDGFVHCYDSLIALNIYFNNKNCDDGLKIADNYVKNSSIQEINMDINFDEVLTNLINELMSVVKSLEKYTNRKIVRIK